MLELYNECKFVCVFIWEPIFIQTQAFLKCIPDETRLPQSELKLYYAGWILGKISCSMHEAFPAFFLSVDNTKRIHTRKKKLKQPKQIKTYLVQKIWYLIHNTCKALVRILLSVEEYCPITQGYSHLHFTRTRGILESKYN